MTSSLLSAPHQNHKESKACKGNISNPRCVSDCGFTLFHAEQWTSQGRKRDWLAAAQTVSGRGIYSILVHLANIYHHAAGLKVPAKFLNLPMKLFVFLHMYPIRVAAAGATDSRTFLQCNTPDLIGLYDSWLQKNRKTKLISCTPMHSSRAAPAFPGEDLDHRCHRALPYLWSGCNAKQLG